MWTGRFSSSRKGFPADLAEPTESPRGQGSRDGVRHRHRAVPANSLERSDVPRPGALPGHGGRLQMTDWVKGPSVAACVVRRARRGFRQ